jgi:hypothetical protein
MLVSALILFLGWFDRPDKLGETTIYANAAGQGEKDLNFSNYGASYDLKYIVE